MIKETMCTIIPDNHKPFSLNHCFILQHQISYLAFDDNQPKSDPVFKIIVLENVKFPLVHRLSYLLQRY
jgi:hypothetical protein